MRDRADIIDEICELVEGVSACIPDPNECEVDADCPPGQLCRDHFAMGYLVCVDPSWGCITHDECDYNEFCEDPEGDGTFDCYDHFPACRLGHDVGDCGGGYICVDPDGDGYGECVVAP